MGDGRASLSAPESLTRGHESTTSQVRVSGTERDTSSHGPLHLLTQQLSALSGFRLSFFATKMLKEKS